MKFELKNLKETVKELTIELDQKEAQAAYDKSLKTIAKTAEIKGFRKGKAPDSAIIERYEADIKMEVSEMMMHSYYGDILAKENIKPVEQPKLSFLDITKDKAVLKIEIEVLPAINVGKYKGLQVEKAKYEFKEEVLNGEIKAMAEKMGKLKEVEGKAQNGDVANINFEGFVDGVAFNGGKAEGYELKLGTHSFVDTFEDQIVGHVKGDEFDVVVNFPENYQPDLAGKKATFKCKLNAVKRVEVPEVDDGLAKELGYEDLTELKTNKKSEIEKREIEKIEADFIEKVLVLIKNDTKLEVPEALIRRETEYRLGQMEAELKEQGATLDQYLAMIKTTKDDLMSKMRSSVEDKVKLDLILEQISIIEKVTVTDEEVDKRVEEVAVAYNTDVSALTAQLKKSGRYDVFIDNLKIDKVIQKTIDKIVSETIVK